MTAIKRLSSLALSCALAATALQPCLSFAADKPAESKPQAAAKQAASPDETLATVNGAPIKRIEIDRAVKAFMAQNRGMQQPTGEQLKQLESAALEQMIAAEMLYQAGLKLELKDADKLVEQKINQSKARFPSPAEFEAALKANNLSEKDLKELTRKDVIINNLVEKEIASKVDISDQEAEKFYKENIGKFKRDEGVKASHILIGVDAKAGEGDKKKAREKAESVLKKAKAGEDFAALAKDNSTCPSKAQGGDLGYFGKGQMVAPFEKAAFSMKPGEISDVVETQFGFHIIKLTDKKEAETTSFAEVKGKLKDYLKNQKIQQAVGEYLNDLKGKAKVERISSSK